ncbi:MAG: ABC transporter ATP-binding protein [bacterium]|nr:ABC transporter ATP-binding protein [Candidatus Sumerlaeota bacterium]
MTMLQIERLTHRFGGLCAVQDFNLNLAAGELVGIIGPNGAGKTTVFNLITGIYRPASGSIRFKGKELAGKTSNAIASKGIARTFQNIRLFKDLSVLDNVRIAHYAQTRYSALEALLHAGRYRAEERRVRESAMLLLKTFRLEKHTHEYARNLPYGLQRRLEMARALAIRPALMLLDEPAAGMNPREIKELMDYIMWIRGQFELTILLIEHRMRLVMGICERIKVLDFGATIAEGRPDEVRNNPLVLEAYLGNEAER